MADVTEKSKIKFDEFLVDDADLKGYSAFSRVSQLNSEYPTLYHDGNGSLIDE